MIYVYGDDGSDEKSERVCAVSVLAGYEHWWKDLEQKWNARCNGIPFHAKDCESDQGDYRAIPHHENKAMYRDLTTILAESPIGGIAIAIDLVAQKEIFPGSMPLAYYRAYLEAIQRTALLAENLGEVAEMTFDISTENEYNAGLAYSYMRDGDTNLRHWLHPKLSFVRAKDSARVQTADLLAYEGWKALDHTVGPNRRRRKSWGALRATGRFQTLSYSTDWFNDLKRNIQNGNLPTMVRFDQSDYLAWLSKMERQHNLSNLFVFLDVMRRRDDEEQLKRYEESVREIRLDNATPDTGFAQRDQSQAGSGEGSKKAEG